MAKILLISDDKNIQTIIQTTLLNDEFLIEFDLVNIMDIMKVETPDVVMIDSEVKNIDLKALYRNIKNFHSIIFLIMGETQFPQELLLNSHLFCSLPINQSVLKSTISSGLKVKKSISKLSSTNKDLANSLYQLNVLYSTSSQLAGSLNREKLVQIMNEGIDKSLNPDVSCTLSFKDKHTPVLSINTNYNLSDRLIEALKLRAVLNYKNSNVDKSDILNIEEIIVEKNIKDNIGEYDFEILNYNKLLSYISIDDDCFGYSEIFREKEFTSDDSKCFLTLVNQLTLPLKSAILYQEITDKNIKLAKLERLKSEFISIVSHELKTPLTSIKNSLDIISGGKAGALSESMSKFLDMAKRNVKKLGKIINDLLDMSKIEAGKMDYNYKIASVVPVISDVKLNLAQIAKQKNLEINLFVDGDISDVYIDTDRIEQVLSNLISNAIKFSSDSSDINITVKQVSSENIVVEDCFKQQIAKLDGDYVQICVSDNGIGIAKDDLIHVFDKFEQIENSLSRDVGGSGLGLSIAKQLVSDHDGAIWCHSIVNKGADFYFVIPVANKNTIFKLNMRLLSQEAKINNKNLLMIIIKSKNPIVKNLEQEKNLWKNYDKKDSIVETENGFTVLKVVIADDNIRVGRQIEEQINNILSLQKEKYEKCDIMYSYRVVEEVSDEKSAYC